MPPPPELPPKVPVPEPKIPPPLDPDPNGPLPFPSNLNAAPPTPLAAALKSPFDEADEAAKPLNTTPPLLAASFSGDFDGDFSGDFAGDFSGDFAGVVAAACAELFVGLCGAFSFAPAGFGAGPVAV